MKQETIDRIRKFTADRDWEQYGNSIIHRPISPSPFPSKQGNCWNAFSGVIRIMISGM